MKPYSLLILIFYLDFTYTSLNVIGCLVYLIEFTVQNLKHDLILLCYKYLYQLD